MPSVRAGALALLLLAASAAATHLAAAPPAVAVQSEPALAPILARASDYVAGYESAFSLLVSEEHYVQEVQRPLNAGTNISRANPGGGVQGGNVVHRAALRSDFLLVQLGPGAGWMPFRDVFELNAAKVRDREDRLAKLFLTNDDGRFELADKIMAESTRYNVGSVTRTINIPTLALMFLHPQISGRFAFRRDGEDTVAGRRVVRISYRETARPTLIKTTRGRDLALEGQLWIEPETGAVVKTALNAADPAVRAQVSVTFRQDEGLSIWVPEEMKEYYKADRSADEIFATATYSNVRKFQVNTAEKIGKPPGG